MTTPSHSATTNQTTDAATDGPEAPDQSTPGIDAPANRGSRVFVYAGSALALLLVGAAIGMLITSARTGESGSPATESVDVGFAQDMRAHHLQAITMATIVQETTTDTAVRALAFDIEGGQLLQVGMMNGWLQLWERAPNADRGAHLAWLPSGQAGHTTHTGTATASGGVDAMPGMATPAEITKLRSLSGRELDVCFLQLMLRHHQGGLPMALYAAEPPVSASCAIWRTRSSSPRAATTR